VIIQQIVLGGFVEANVKREIPPVGNSQRGWLPGTVKISLYFRLIFNSFLKVIFF